MVIAPIQKNGEIGAFYFHLFGLDLVLNLFPGHAPPTLRSLGLSEENFPAEHVLDSPPMYRIPRVDIEHSGGGRTEVEVQW